MFLYYYSKIILVLSLPLLYLYPRRGGVVGSVSPPLLNLKIGGGARREGKVFYLLLNNKKLLILLIY
jgi:hypothetical protein